MPAPVPRSARLELVLDQGRVLAVGVGSRTTPRPRHWMPRHSERSMRCVSGLRPVHLGPAATPLAPASQRPASPGQQRRIMTWTRSRQASCGVCTCPWTSPPRSFKSPRATPTRLPTALKRVASWRVSWCVAKCAAARAARQGPSSHSVQPDSCVPPGLVDMLCHPSPQAGPRLVKVTHLIIPPQTVRAAVHMHPPCRASHGRLTYRPLVSPGVL